MNKAGLFSLFIFITALVLFSCSSNNADSHENKYQTTIELKDEFLDIINNAVSKSDTLINFNTIKSVEWNLFYIVPPYSNLDSTSVYFALDFNPVKTSNIEQRDDINVIVFFNKEQFIGFFEMPRSKYSFIKKGKLNVQQIPKEHCVFVVKHDSITNLVSLKKH